MHGLSLCTGIRRGVLAAAAVIARTSHRTARSAERTGLLVVEVGTAYRIRTGDLRLERAVS